jgi:hypothetical protein
MMIKSKIFTMPWVFILSSPECRAAGIKQKMKSGWPHSLKNVPLEFLRMIVVHELAHLKEKDHNKAFYKLCVYMDLLITSLNWT